MRTVVTHFFVKMKGLKAKAGIQDGRRRMTRKQITALMEKSDCVCVNGLIYNNRDKVVGRIERKQFFYSEITKADFETKSVLELMTMLGSASPGYWYDHKSKGFGIKAQGLKINWELE